MHDIAKKKMLIWR